MPPTIVIKQEVQWQPHFMELLFPDLDIPPMRIYSFFPCRLSRSYCDERNDNKRKINRFFPESHAESAGLLLWSTIYLNSLFCGT